MQQLLIPLAMAAAFGAFIGALFRLSRLPGRKRPLLFPLVGLIAGITAFFIHYVLVSTVGAPIWLLPVLVVVQIWLWLGPLGPKVHDTGSGDNGR
ncbi:hypothetical protein [Halomonas heilongjiangensis]|uniref:Uncharacterized protein n=1 Tax=Halomonas heilongjiangensis TaxID=1387883 RepID=A0A2N7TNP6_9GAMM|nr:hypothetical protein [Halomonas heilongjiangensis]PMR69817.1 hypothetical protein C1H66_09260 [Halomonas heilongjiangensis]PXX92114.1 hypothetical protein CR158_06405 [Halomonas heilongjiangensis]